jgi:hypothetical protein
MTAPDPDAKRDQATGAAVATPTALERAWLRHGLDQPGGKLPLFDNQGQRVSERTIRSCIEHGWAKPWFDNPLKPDWLVCRLTHLGAVVCQEPAQDGDAADPDTDSSSGRTAAES